MLVLLAFRIQPEGFWLSVLLPAGEIARLAFRIQPEGFWLSVLLPAGEIALVAIPTCNPTLALWHFGTLALWHFGTLALWHGDSYVDCLTFSSAREMASSLFLCSPRRLLNILVCPRNGFLAFPMQSEATV